jgi:hypothetical protein
MTKPDFPFIASRILPPSEWATKLKGTALEGIAIDPAYAKVIVVEQGGEVVACWSSMSIIHVEGLWTSPDAGAGVARALLGKMVETLQEIGVPEVLTQSLTPQVDQLIEKAGGRRVPGQTWVIPVKEL